MYLNMDLAKNKIAKKLKKSATIIRNYINELFILYCISEKRPFTNFGSEGCAPIHLTQARDGNKSLSQ